MAENKKENETESRRENKAEGRRENKNENPRRDNSNIWVAVIALIALLFVLSFGFRWTGYGMMGMMYGNYGWWMALFGFAFGIAFLIAFALFLAWLVREIQKK